MEKILKTMKNTTRVLLLSFFIMTGCTQLAQKGNPFFESWENNSYRIPPFSRIKEAHYLPALQEGIRRQNEAIEAIVKNEAAADFENTVLALQQSGEMIEKVAGVLFNVVAAQSTEGLREIESEAVQLLSAQNDNIYMNPALFERVKQVKKNGAFADEVQGKLVEDTYRQFVLNGAELKPEQQEALREINTKLSEAENKFSQNLLLATAKYELLVEDSARLEGLPAGDMERAAAKAAQQGKKGYLFGLDNPTIMPFLQYVKDAGLRKEILDAYAARCAAGSEFDNTPVVKDIVRLRMEKAQLLGFPDYASYALQTRMAKTPQAVYALMEQIWPAALQRAKEELAEMKAYRAQHEKVQGEFLPSDWRYYANKVREEKYALDENTVKGYFSLDSVRKGVFYLAERLYGITFEPYMEAEMPTPNTSAYICKDQDGSVLGILFLDMLARPGQKSGGAWNTSYVEQAYNGQTRLTPVTSIVCNYTPAVDGQPVLLSIDEAETFFHEFGHALHALFSEVKYKGLSETPRDFVELPSQVMEHWALHPQMLKVYARHHQTGETIPDELIERIQAAKLYGQGFATTELLAAALLDMDYHTISRMPEGFDPAVFEAESTRQRGLIAEIYPRYKTNYFAHTMGGGYSAGYYSYTWAEVLDADTFEAYEESGDIFNRKIASSFRNDILKNGGMYDAMKMYVKFRGHEPEVKALLKSRGL